MTKHITLTTAIAAALSLTATYSAYADVPNTFSAGQAASAAAVNENFTDLDGRVGALEAAAVNPVMVAIDCAADADALKDADIKADTTYNIAGACNGPIYVEDDNVHLLGSDNATDSIVLAAGLDESAVFAGGANNLQISNLFLDLTATTTANQTAGLWARNSYVQVNDSRIEGGSAGINPFRGAIVRLNGTNSITEFANAGLSVTDQSNINTRGQTTVTSTRVDDQFMKAIRVRNGSSVDIRSGITISVPTSTRARSIDAEANASVRIGNSGTVTLTGDVLSDQNSTISIEKGTINGDIDVSRSSSMRMRNGIIVTGEVEVGDTSHLRMDGGSISDVIEVYRGGVVKLQGVTQTSDDIHAVRVNSNSILNADNSNLGRFSVFANSTISLGTDDDGVSTVKGGNINVSSVGTINNTSSTADIEIFPSGVLHLTGNSNLNGNNLYLCNSTASYIDGSVQNIGNSTSTSDCP